MVNEQKIFCSHQCSPECSMNKFRAYVSTYTCFVLPRLKCRTFKHSVTHNSTISQDLLKRTKEMLWLTGSLDFLIFHHFYIELCYFQSSIISILTHFGAAHGWQKDSPSLKCFTHILQWWNLTQLYLTSRRSKKYLNHLKQSLISDFLIENWQILLYQEMQILLTFFESLKML